jgi:hypothetical protein
MLQNQVLRLHSLEAGGVVQLHLHLILAVVAPHHGCRCRSAGGECADKAREQCRSSLLLAVLPVDCISTSYLCDLAHQPFRAETRNWLLPACSGYITMQVTTAAPPTVFSACSSRQRAMESIQARDLACPGLEPQPL